jgi:UDP-glucose 4-epimerase
VSSATVFGGAGFIGSNICAALAGAGWHVTAIDGLLPRTTGDKANISRLGADVELIATPVEAIGNLGHLVEGRDLVVDAMGWTRHLDAIRDPAYDLALNLAAHLPVIRACTETKPARVVYLASRHQYGNVTVRTINEETPLAPIDPQGIHKTATEQHWCIASKDRFAFASLRFGNTFGPNQPVGEGDAGLIGGFIRDALRGRTIELFGGHRVRNVLFAPDIAAAILRLGSVHLTGTNLFNVAGADIAIGEMTRLIIDAAGSGDMIEKPMPEEIARIDIGEAAFDGSRFDGLVGKVALTSVADAIRMSVEQARGRLAN